MSPRDQSSSKAADTARKAQWTIGELAEEFGLTHRSIRYYEDEGLLSPKRDGQARIYSYRDHARLALICRGKRLGFKIAEIRDFLKLYHTEDRQVSQMHFLLGGVSEKIEILEQQLQDVKTTLKELKDIRGAITAHLEQAGEAETATSTNNTRKTPKE